MALESIQIEESQIERRGHRSFDLSLNDALCCINDNGGCITYNKLFINSRLNFKELNKILNLCIGKGFVKQIRNNKSNKRFTKIMSEKYPNLNIVNSRKLIMLTDRGLSFIKDYSDYFIEADYIFSKPMSRSR